MEKPDRTLPELYPYHGSIDGERFLSFSERLIPKLNHRQVVVMDNLRVHHMKAVKERFAQANIRLLYLPPYSPEPNPIEEAWSIIKRILRSLEATTIAAFIDAMNLAKENVTIDKIAAFFKHAAYAL
jgi:transposase